MGNSDQDTEHVGTFADGARTLPHTAADHTPGHFSEGLERDHEALSRVAGNFSEGDLQAHADHERKGSFGDTDCPVCRAMAEAARAGS
jgi:hypothetical protein